MRTLLLAALAALPALAAPDFSGNWKLDPAKSDFGPMPPPQSIVMVVKHKGNDLSYVSQQKGGPLGDIQADFKYTTNGVECKNTVMGNETRTTVKWSGEVLRLNSKVVWQGDQIAMDNQWKLSEDGKQLQISRHVTTPDGGGVDMKFVFVKQAEATK